MRYRVTFILAAGLHDEQAALRSIAGASAVER
jgi:hypothetical protein